MVEYALILSLVLVAATPLLRAIGLKVQATFQAAMAGFDP
jgi:Flp pilus assembly pilin Flp